MLASPGATGCALTCSWAGGVRRAPCSSPVAFGEPSDKEKSFQGWIPDAAMLGAWKQEGSPS